MIVPITREIKVIGSCARSRAANRHYFGHNWRSSREGCGYFRRSPQSSSGRITINPLDGAQPSSD